MRHIWSKWFLAPLYAWVNCFVTSFFFYHINFLFLPVMIASRGNSPPIHPPAATPLPLFSLACKIEKIKCYCNLHSPFLPWLIGRIFIGREHSFNKEVNMIWGRKETGSLGGGGAGGERFCAYSLTFHNKPFLLSPIQTQMQTKHSTCIPQSAQPNNSSSKWFPQQTASTSQQKANTFNPPSAEDPFKQAALPKHQTLPAPSRKERPHGKHDIYTQQHSSKQNDEGEDGTTKLWVRDGWAQGEFNEGMADVLPVQRITRNNIEYHQRTGQGY